MEELARRIVELRKALDPPLSSEKLAQRIGVSHKTVITWEKDRGDPSVDNLLELCRVFGVTPDYLVGWANELSARNGEGAEPDQAAGQNAASDEEALEGSARTEDRRQKRARRGPTTRPGS